MQTLLFRRSNALWSFNKSVEAALNPSQAAGPRYFPYLNECLICISRREHEETDMFALLGSLLGFDFSVNHTRTLLGLQFKSGSFQTFPSQDWVETSRRNQAVTEWKLCFLWTCIHLMKPWWFLSLIKWILRISKGVFSPFSLNTEKSFLHQWRKSVNLWGDHVSPSRVIEMLWERTVPSTLADVKWNKFESCSSTKNITFIPACFLWDYSQWRGIFCFFTIWHHLWPQKIYQWDVIPRHRFVKCIVAGSVCFTGFHWLQ